MSFVDDLCLTCHEDASRHTWCDVERRLVCVPCDHPEPCEDKP